MNAGQPGRAELLPVSQSFALSRIYAKGWAAGADHASDDGDLAALADKLNPGKTPEERARWRQGFDAAIERNSTGPARKKRMPRKPGPGSAR